MARTKKAASAETVIDPAIHAPSGQPWAFGVRTWDKDGASHGGFLWNLEPGTRTEAPDWSPRAECGYGLHCNPDGMGDWSLLSDAPDAIIGIVRFDPALRVDLDGKIKAPWMEVVMTTKTASRSSIMSFVAARVRAQVAELTAKASEATATKRGEHASAAGYMGHASAAGDSGHASAAGDRGHASAAGKYGVAAAFGFEGSAQAAETGAIILAHWTAPPWNNGKLTAVFAGMVGQTYGDVTIEAGASYRLKADGAIEQVTP